MTDESPADPRVDHRDAADGIELVLFDFGGVVLRTPFELLPDDVAWRGPFAPEEDALWRRSMAAEITERDYWHLRASELHPGARDPTFALMRQLYEVDEARLIRPEVLALVDAVERAGLRVAVLTNDLAAFHGPAWIDRIKALDRFERVIDLSHTDFLKPSGKAFAHALDVLDVPADGVLFVDDQPPNVAGARAAGVRAMFFDPTDVAASVDRVASTLDLAVPT